MTAKYDADGMPLSFGDADVQAWMREPEVQALLRTPLGTKVYYIGHFEGESCAHADRELRSEWHWAGADFPPTKITEPQEVAFIEDAGHE